MAKPITYPRKWATDALYSSGPFIGDIAKVDPGVGIAAEGHRPGASYPTAAEHENYQQNEVTTWIVDWLALGSSLGATDAHIVETNAAGHTTLAGLHVVDAVDETAFTVTSANTFAPGSLFTCTTGATIIQIDMGTAAGIGFAAPVGTGAGTGFSASLISSPVGAYGVDVSVDAASAGIGIRITAAGSGVAFKCDGSTAATRGATFTGGTTSALLATGSGAGLGGDFVSGATAGASALRGTTNNTTGSAVIGAVPVGATSAARAFFASVGGSAIAAEFVASANYALKITGDTSAPVNAPLFVTESNALPTSITTGQIARVRQGGGGNPSQTMESCFEDFGVGIGEGWRGFLSTTGGSALGQAYTVGPYTTAAINTWYQTLSMSSGSGNAPKTAGRQVLMRVTFSWRVTPIGTAATMGLRIIDVTADPGAASPVFQRSGIGSGANAGYLMPYMTDVNWSVPMVIFCPVTVPAAGGRTWRLDLLSSGPGLITIRDISFDYLGML